MFFHYHLVPSALLPHPPITSVVCRLIHKGINADHVYLQEMKLKSCEGVGGINCKKKKKRIVSWMFPLRALKMCPQWLWCKIHSQRQAIHKCLAECKWSESGSYAYKNMPYIPITFQEPFNYSLLQNQGKLF